MVKQAGARSGSATQNRRGRAGQVENNGLFRALVETSPDATVVVGMDGTVRYESPAMPGLLGYPLEERIGKSGLELVHPDDLEDAASALSELAQTAGATVLREVRARHADGSWRVLQVVGKNLVHDPAVRGIVASFRDVTDLRRLEQMWGESEDQYRALLEHATDGVVIFQEGVIKFANRALSEITGYTNEELVGMPLGDIIYPEDEREIAQKYTSRLKGEPLPPLMEVRIRRKDGTAVTIEASGTAIQYGGRPADMGIVRDVTERDRMQTALAESEDMWRTLVETAPERITTVDRNGTVLFASRVTPGHTVEEAIGSSLYDYVTPEAGKTVRKALRAVFESSRTETWTAEAAGLDSEKRWYKTSAGPVLRDGKVVAAIMVSMDITERKRVEDELAQSEEWHRALVDIAGKAGLGVTIIQNTEERQGAFVYANDQYCLMTGYSRDELSGMSFLDTVAPDDREAIQERYRRRQKGKQEPGMYEARLLRRDGTIMPVEISVCTMTYGGRVATASFFRDIIDRRKAEEDLRHSEEYFRALIESSYDAITVLDMNGTRRYQSPSYERVLGRPLEAEEGTSVLDYVFEEDVPRAASAFERLVREPGAVMREEVRVWHKDGSLRVIEVVARNLVDVPAVQGIVTNFREIFLSS